MSKPQIRRPSTGTVLGTLALIVAVAGNANAFSASHLIVRKGDIAKGAVTARALAKGAVRSPAIAKGAVGAKALGKGAVGAAAIKGGAVTAAALGPDAVTASALAPGSVYGGALGTETVHAAPIQDADTIAHNGEWTTSQGAEASCAPGERVIGGGLVIGEPGNGEVIGTEAVPVSNGPANGFAGRITSDSGGTAKAEVQTYCLK
jgi:hypothetical protein